MRSRIYIATVILTFIFSTIGWAATSSTKTDTGTSKEEPKAGCPNAEKKGACCSEGQAQPSMQNCPGECADNLCSSKVDQTLEWQPSWILSSAHENAFSLPLVEFTAIHGRFPYDISEFLESGLCIAWPANPETGKPLRIVDKVNPRKEDLGKIAYVRKSDCEAHFEIVVPYNKAYSIYEFPCCIKTKEVLGQLEKEASLKEMIRQSSFERTIGDLIAMAFTRMEKPSSDGKIPGLKEAVKNNFFLVEENIAPKFLSADPKTPLFFEKGIATLDGKKVKFEEYTVRSLDENGKEFLDHFYWVEPLLEKNVDYGEDDTAWNRMTGKEFFYSTKQIVAGKFTLPSDMVLTRAQILAGR